MFKKDNKNGFLKNGSQATRWQGNSRDEKKWQKSRTSQSGGFVTISLNKLKLEILSQAYGCSLCKKETPH